MKKQYLSVLTILTIMCAMPLYSFAQENGEDQQEQKSSDLSVVIPNSVDIDLTDKYVNTENLNPLDNNQITDFVKKYVPGVPEGTLFVPYRVNTDIKGYTHIDLQQYVEVSGKKFKIDGKEIILHVDEDNYLCYITGDLETENPVNTQSKPSMAKVKQIAINDHKTECVIVKMNGKNIFCTAIHEGKDKVYYSVETGEVVKRESMIRCAEPQTNRKTITSNTYYYPASAMYVGSDANYRDMNVAQRADGKYVLQDPERKIYTLEYNTPEIIQYNLPQPYQSLEAPYAFNLNDALAFGEDIASDTEDFTAQHTTLASVVKSITISNFDELAGNEDGTYRMEIREFDASMVSHEDIINTWNEAPLLASAVSLYNPETSEDVLIFDNLDEDPKNNLNLSFPTREEDPSGAVENKMWMLALYKNDHMLDVTEIPLCHTTKSTSCSFDPYWEVSHQMFVERHTTQYKPALDIHWGLQRVQDVYKNSFGVNSFDGKGTAMLAMINPYGYENNAYAAGTNTNYNSDDEKFGIMGFGMGIITHSPTQYGNYAADGNYPFSDLETVGHEFTHLVASKLAYKNESGALNESYADIMGKMVEYKVLDHEAGYSVGDDVTKYVSWRCSQIIMLGSPQGIMRRFDNPNAGGDPQYFKGFGWLDYNTSDYDNGGVHINAGVQNHWFYLLCTGGDVTPEQGEAVTITPIDRDDAELITFASLMYCGIKNLDYQTARRNSIRIAEMYYGKDSQQVKTVMDAWYAVGVGTDEWQPDMPTSINAINSVNKSKYAPARKMIDNGNLVITKNGKHYNVTGQEI